MVLSNKKLKEKLRTLLAESLAKSESQVNQSNPNDLETHQSFKSLLNSASQKPKLSKREIRRVKVPSLPRSSELQNHENGDEERASEEGNGGLEKNKKRKREKDGVEVKGEDKEENEVKDTSEMKSSKKKNKKKKNKKKKVVKKEEESLQKADPVCEEQPVAEPIQIQTSKEDESISTKLYVGGIPYYSTVDDIRSFFEACGSITEIDCLKFPETGKFNGIAMISFRTEAAAKRALSLDGSDMGGLSLKVQPYKATRDKKVSDFAPAMLEGYNRIYVGNLSWDMTEDELKKFFSDCSISSIRLGKDKETGEFRGFAHVDFSDSLSLTMALKLDQKPLFGRPVRIRCAVPPKSANPGSNSISKSEENVKLMPVSATRDAVVDDDVAKKAKRQTCYECGEKGHLSSSCPNKQAADVAHTDYTNNDYEYKEEVDDGKLKRRTCYECGEKGHLSSSCPNKQVADVAIPGTETFAYVDNEMVSSVSEGKLKRRTCYECGEKGHLSSLCPKKQAADVAKLRKEADDVEVEKVKEFKSVVDVKGEGDNVGSSVSEGKLRRRTCYECGERGHLSSLCPKKQAADVASLRKEGDDMEVEKAEEIKSKEVVGCVGGGKLRRRTCYECGEKGHLSSLCPNKKEADLTKNTGST